MPAADIKSILFECLKYTFALTDVFRLLFDVRQYNVEEEMVVYWLFYV
jgi:hypothetical protein